MTDQPMSSPEYIVPDPARVLLLGSDWESMDGTLSAIADSGFIILMGPAASYDSRAYDARAFDRRANDSRATAGPSVLLISPEMDADAPDRNGDDTLPQVLRCVADDDLDTPGLYRDCDDFVTVPCAAAELSKRILRLAQRHRAANAPPDLIRVGGISLNPGTYEVAVNGEPVGLAWLEFRLLQFLMENAGRVFTRDRLLAEVWGVENIGGTRTVDVHIRRLRYKLETGATTYFRTVKNVGYGMVEP